MAKELLAAGTGKAESERKRKQAEASLMEATSRLAEIERAKSELSDRVTRLQAEADAITQQLEEAELKASTAAKAQATMESQLLEAQVCQIFNQLFEDS